MGFLSEFEALRLNWAYWTVGFQDLSVWVCQCWGYKHVSIYAQFYVGAGELNSGLCAYVASAFAYWTISSVPFSEVFWGMCFLFCRLGFIMYEFMITLLWVMKLEAPHMDRVDILLII